MKKFDTIVIILMGVGCISLVVVVAVIFAILRSRAGNSSTVAFYTQGAQTLQAQLTIAALQTYTSQTTPLAPFPTPTSFPTFAGYPTPTRQQFPTLTSSYPTSAPPPATAVPPPCNMAQFVRDVTAPDGTSLPPNASFSKVWRLKNIGSCTWDSNYSLVFVNGDRLSGSNSSPLAQVVNPGETIDVGVALIAPTAKGKYKGNWMLEDSRGRQFGIGSDSRSPFWVNIQVMAPNASYAFDLAVNLCKASWRSSAGNLPCLSNTASSAGSQALIFNPVFENGKDENEATLWLRPQTKVNGWVQAVYPAYTVNVNDHFVSQVGCLKNNQGCDVTFTLDYILSNGTIHNLGQWHEVYDGNITTIDIDLSSLAGNAIQFVLTVTAVNNPEKANAFWFVPDVRQKAPTPTPTQTRTPTPTATVTPTPTSTLAPYP